MIDFHIENADKNECAVLTVKLSYVQPYDMLFPSHSVIFPSGMQHHFPSHARIGPPMSYAIQGRFDAHVSSQLGRIHERIAKISMSRSIVR
jgi:hypothetical protein